MLLLAINRDQPFHHLDIKNVFLKGDLKEEVYIEILSCLKIDTNINKVNKIKKKNPYMVPSNIFKLSLIVLPKLQRGLVTFNVNLTTLCL